MCVMTRLRLRNLVVLLQFLRMYRTMAKELRGSDGLLHAALLFETPLTIYMLSMWESAHAAYLWGAKDTHVAVVHRTYGWSCETWSGFWRIESVSPSAHRWSQAPAIENMHSPDRAVRRGG